MAISTPSWVRCSSTMRVMVVMHTSAASRKKNSGNTRETPATMLVSLSKHT